MKYLKLLLLLIITLISTSVVSISAGLLEIKDTTIERGKIYKIQVNGSIPSTLAENIEIELLFDAMVIDIKQVTGNNTYGLPANLNYNIDMSDLKQSKIIISAASFKKDFSGIICELAVEGLAGKDTSCNIEPVSMILDKDSLKDAVFIKGKIIVNSVPVELKYMEGLGQNYPNPYYNNTTFPFTIEKETHVSFKLFSLNCRRLNIESDMNDIIQITVYDEEGNIVDKPSEYLFSRGSYTIELKPYSWKLSSGMYILSMTTGDGFYKKNFIYIK